jgi:endonuclease YncB( thermonuclease family)
VATPAAFRSWPKSLTPSYGPYAAILDRWLDADTGLFLTSLGFGQYAYVEIRLLGYSSPESNTPKGKAATAFANDLAPPGSRVLLHSEKPVQTFTRFVARIELEHGLDYGEMLFKAGHARIGAFEG